jgi:hypothetical protein
MIRRSLNELPDCSQHGSQAEPNHVGEEYWNQAKSIGTKQIGDHCGVLIEGIPVRRMTRLTHHIHEDGFAAWKGIFLILVNEHGYEVEHEQSLQHGQVIPCEGEIRSGKNGDNSSNVVPIRLWPSYRRT